MRVLILICIRKWRRLDDGRRIARRVMLFDSNVSHSPGLEFHKALMMALLNKNTLLHQSVRHCVMRNCITPKKFWIKDDYLYVINFGNEKK